MTSSGNEAFGSAQSGRRQTQRSVVIVSMTIKRVACTCTRTDSGICEDNEIFGNGYTGIDSYKGGNPVVRNNRINKNAHFGVQIYEDGRWNVRK